MHRVQRSDEGSEGRELEERHRVLTESALLESQLLRQQVEEERRAGTEERVSAILDNEGTEGQRDAMQLKRDKYASLPPEMRRALEETQMRMAEQSLSPGAPSPSRDRSPSSVPAVPLQLRHGVGQSSGQ